MGSDFMSQFQAGWQLGQQRKETQRRDQELAMERQRQEQEQERRDAAFQLQQEEFKLRKKQLAAEEHASRLEAAKEAFQMRTQAASMQGLPTPTAAEVGVPEQGPEMAGPMAGQVNVPQPAMAMPNPMEGQPDISMPVLTGQQQQEMAQAEQQKKMREALGMLEATEGIKAQYREQPKSLAEIFAEAKARASGGRAGAPPVSGGGSLTGEGGKPLLSGEINKFNDFRSGLNTLGRLSGEVEKTGAASKAGAMVPGLVTELTGIGTEAKSRQAVLDQAKQVVGKAMEGGVLRKEDEAKYMRILPIISDPPDVAKAKLENLKSVMAQDAEIYIETLEAAGRNVTKIRETLQKQLGEVEAKPQATGGSKYKIIEVR